LSPWAWFVRLIKETREELRSMATEWRSREVAITLPKTTLEAMWARARRSFDLTEGGRYDARSRTTMLLWSSQLTAPGAEPIGAFTVRWEGPDPRQATIQLVAWTPRRGGSEAQVWRAMKVLAGVDWNVRPVRGRHFRTDQEAA
jgi:hypothetical protein